MGLKWVRIGLKRGFNRLPELCTVGFREEGGVEVIVSQDVGEGREHVTERAELGGASPGAIPAIARR